MFWAVVFVTLYQCGSVLTNKNLECNSTAIQLRADDEVYEFGSSAATRCVWQLNKADGSERKGVLEIRLNNRSSSFWNRGDCTHDYVKILERGDEQVVCFGNTVRVPLFSRAAEVRYVHGGGNFSTSMTVAYLEDDCALELEATRSTNVVTRSDVPQNCTSCNLFFKAPKGERIFLNLSEIPSGAIGFTVENYHSLEEGQKTTSIDADRPLTITSSNRALVAVSAEEELAFRLEYSISEFELCSPDDATPPLQVMEHRKTLTRSSLPSRMTSIFASCRWTLRVPPRRTPHFNMNLTDGLSEYNRLMSRPRRDVVSAKFLELQRARLPPCRIVELYNGTYEKMHSQCSDVTNGSFSVEGVRNMTVKFLAYGQSNFTLEYSLDYDPAACRKIIRVTKKGYHLYDPPVHPTANLTCYWILRGRKGQRISVTVESVQFATSTYVSKQISGLVVRDGDAITSPAVFNSSSVEPKLKEKWNSSGDVVSVTYTKVPYFEAPHFHLIFNVSTHKEPCRKTIEVSEIQETLHHAVRDVPESCSWTLIAPPNYQIQISVVEVYVRRDDECQNFLEIKELSDAQEGRRRAKYCSRQRNLNDLNTDYHHVLINFTVGAGFSDQTFVLKYRGAALDNKINENKSALVATNEIQNISSLNYPDFYPLRRNTTWIIGTPLESRKIRLIIHEGYIEASEDCRHDVLTIYDGSAPESPVVVALCGSIAPRVIVTSGRSTAIRFVSDIAYAGIGFHIGYVLDCQDNATYHETIKFQGQLTITSPLYPMAYPRNVRYSWEIVTRCRSLTVRAVALDLECDFDYLEYSAGNDNSRVCNTEQFRTKWNPSRNQGVISLETPWRNTHDIVYVTFVSDHAISGQGFELYFYNCR